MESESESSLTTDWKELGTDLKLDRVSVCKLRKKLSYANKETQKSVKLFFYFFLHIIDSYSIHIDVKVSCK